MIMLDNYIPPERQDINNAIIPENAEFYEEMKLLVRLAKNYPDDVELRLFAPVSDAEIDGFEKRTNIKLTDELRDLYKFSNGFYLSPSSLEISTLDQIEKMPDPEWDNAKNYLYLGDMIGDGELVLLDLDTNKIITNDHGDEEEYDDLTTLLGCIIIDFLDGEIEDDELEEYLDGWDDVE